MELTKRGVVCAGICLLLAGCSLVGPGRRADIRTDRPPARVFGHSTKTLPGSTITAAKEVQGIWHMSAIEQRPRMEHGVEPFLAYSLYLKLDADLHYELVYSAYWGGRGSNDPRMQAVDVRESGTFSLSGKILLLEPQTTQLAQKRGGKLEKQTIPNANRGYLAALDGAYLNIAGRCAPYQVEPVCFLGSDVWHSLRFGHMQWPVPELQ